MSAAISLAGVDKRLGGRDILCQLSLDVPAGSVFAFLGNNGAGKSTTIRLLTGLLDADRGKVEVLGRPIRSARMALLREVGCLVDSPALYPNLTAAEFLEIGRRIKGLPLAESGRVLDVVGLAGSTRTRIAGFSLGMRQRLALAHAMLGNPRLLILDEPGNGLDPQGMRDIRTLLASLPQQTGCTVFLSSHQIDEVEKIATHLAVLHGGRVLCQEAVPQLLARQPGMFLLEVDDSCRALALLAGLGLTARATGTRMLEIGPIAAAQGPRMHSALVGAGLALYQSVYRTSNLEQWFLDITNPEEVRHARDPVPA
ncbi:ATP-binding cassette domain-containing protein [Massilia brevitalea]|uniref:ATP-binding cassette domain-containing protein n=1 Tax=Massilia brevitalea TaxID=442526 RepID=UPI0027392786|nr:ATP-binding cassette domain-containing protein [Massilia brevitalea]